MSESETLENSMLSIDMKSINIQTSLSGDIGKTFPIIRLAFERGGPSDAEGNPTNIGNMFIFPLGSEEAWYLS